MLEPGSVPVDWFLCWGECSLSGTGFEPCGELVPGQSERCHVGPSGVLDVKAGTKFTSAQLEEIIDGEQFALRYLRVALIAQDPRSNRVPSCRDRVLEGRRGEDLSDCQLARRTIHLGPPGPLILAAEQIGFALPEGLPPELAADLPNFNPKLQEFELIEALAGGGERRQHVAPSGVATVSVGSRVTVRPIVLEVDQTNHEFGSMAEEHNSLYWHVMHAHADALDVAADTGTVWSTRAPAVDLNASFSTDSPLASASPLHLAVTLADSREGEDVAWLRVEVAAQ